jgi:hypothetical protein
VKYEEEEEDNVRETLNGVKWPSELVKNDIQALDPAAVAALSLLLLSAVLL